MRGPGLSEPSLRHLRKLSDRAGRIILGTRGSDLARAQARLVEAALRKAWPELEVAIEIIPTSGDERRPSARPIRTARPGERDCSPARSKRSFSLGESMSRCTARRICRAKRLDDWKSARRCRGLRRRMFWSRRPAAVSRRSPSGSDGRDRQRAAATSARLDAAGPEIVDLRGNVPTRLRKLRENRRGSGIILARAGSGSGSALRQLRQARFFRRDDICPGGRPGMVALQVRSDDARDAASGRRDQ